MMSVHWLWGKHGSMRRLFYPPAESGHLSWNFDPHAFDFFDTVVTAHLYA
jgi:hypothetical protein